MSAPTYSDFADRFYGEAILSSNTSVQDWIEDRLEFWWDRHAAWGSDRTEATLLRAAHERQLAYDRTEGKARSSGRVKTGDAAGGWTRSWSLLGVDRGAYAILQQTDWGAEYLALRQSVPTLPFAGGMPRTI